MNNKICKICGKESARDICLFCKRIGVKDGKPFCNCLCGHNIHWHQIEIFPPLLTQTSCRYPGCTCGGFHMTESWAVSCSCTGVYPDGSPRGCCTGGVIGCLCDVDWDEISEL